MISGRDGDEVSRNSRRSEDAIMHRAATRRPRGVNPGDYAYVQNDGNFVIYAANGRALWATGTNGKC
jgi:hypothetical protein